MPIIPNLISPVTVKMEQPDKAATVYDSRAREPVKRVRRASEVELTAQVSWGRSYRAEEWQGGQGGTYQAATGYLVFRVYDLESDGITLSQGDKCTTIGGKDANVFLTNKLYAGHHNGGPTLEIWDFSDHALKEVR